MSINLKCYRYKIKLDVKLEEWYRYCISFLSIIKFDGPVNERSSHSHSTNAVRYYLTVRYGSSDLKIPVILCYSTVLLYYTVLSSYVGIVQKEWNIVMNNFFLFFWKCEEKRITNIIKLLHSSYNFRFHFITTTSFSHVLKVRNIWLLKLCNGEYCWYKISS